MNLFEIKEDQVTVAPGALMLVPFAALWKRDKTKGKKKAMAELSAVYFYADYKSDFSEIMNPTEKLEHVRSFIIGMPEDWEPDEKFHAAVDFYKERQATVSTIILEDAKHAIAKISSFLRNVDLTELDENGKFVYDVKKVNDVIGGLPKTVETIASLERTVKKELQQKDSLRGGHEKALMEDGI
jgi:hypothetical protein